ncbi:MAG: hypothetical protein RBS46_02335 [Methyloversatilis sp.]|jgi:hypothetical protein|nr:hypothetical protein [Methyloversatilis sp.]
MELIDNINGLLGDDLKQTLKPGARLKIAASCFSMYAFEALKAELEKIDELQFIFTSPTFTSNEVTDKIRKERKDESPQGGHHRSDQQRAAEPAQVRRQDAGATGGLPGRGGHFAEGPDSQRTGIAAGNRRSQFLIGLRGLTNGDARCLGPGLPPVFGRRAGAAFHAVATRGIGFACARQSGQANNVGSVFCALPPLQAAPGAGLE